MFPSLDLDEIREAGQSEEEKPGGKSFLYDFKKGDFVMKDGRLVVVEDVEAVKVWIEKLLRTEKFKFKIYKEEDADEYGVTVRKLILGKKFPAFFLQSELKREISEALAKHTKIEKVENFRIEREVATLNIFFTVVLKDGHTFEQEVVF
ncbi:DUF2634 domain-containing protein [Clostridium formicaceticum]|uniref:DUF2634 domain-containing protein n=1 Tax=Clostridium formicaceticum TaxID=1497 RepID=A0AAC9RKA3_9CLOT|nr:DUF2634 domain-containing protein [Clostridium formicaceticum]AOY76690.1 hypothetical protein BJL90_12925 [Clostridium formicaceticum]ARE87122.1 hypothetical protein CLFO_15080 [Clostridium formicaceticum]